MKKNINLFTIIMVLTLCTLFTCFSGSSSSSNDEPVAVSISPKEVTLPLSGRRIFEVTVSNTSNESVTWKCTDGTIQQGMETSNGVYTAPVSPGNFEVEVTSNADSSKKDKAIVHVVSGTLPPPTPPNPPYEGYYDGFIWVDVTGSSGTGCTHSYDNHESFVIFLDNDSSFPIANGKQWQCYTTTSISGTIDEKSNCQYDLDFLTGTETVTPSSFNVALILWNDGSYELAVGAVRYPNCNSNLGTMPGMINATDIHVSSTPNPPNNLSGEQTVPGPLGKGQYKVTWALTKH